MSGEVASCSGLDFLAMQVRRNLPFGHVPEEHRVQVFAGLGAEYGSVEELEKVELWLSVAAAECTSCCQRLVWLLAKDVGAVAALGKVVKWLFTAAPPPEGAHEELMELLRWSSVGDRADLVVEVANDFVARRRAVSGDVAGSLGGGELLVGLEEGGDGLGFAGEDGGFGVVGCGVEEGFEGVEWGEEGDDVP
jgi:hypothetical protein